MKKGRKKERKKEKKKERKKERKKEKTNNSYNSDDVEHSGSREPFASMRQWINENRRISGFRDDLNEYII